MKIPLKVKKFAHTTDVDFNATNGTRFALCGIGFLEVFPEAKGKERVDLFVTTKKSRKKGEKKVSLDIEDGLSRVAIDSQRHDIMTENINLLRGKLELPASGPCTVYIRAVVKN